MISQYLQHRGFAGWVINGEEEYANITWQDGIVLASESEVIAGVEVLSLVAKKTAVLQQLKQECEAQIVSGVHHNGVIYPTKLTDQQNLAAVISMAKEYGDAYAPYMLWVFQGDTWERKGHTPQEIIEVGTVVFMHIKAAQNEYAIKIDARL